MNDAKTHIVTLAGRDSSSGHRKYIGPDYVVGSGQGSVARREYAGLYTQREAEAIEEALQRNGLGAPWAAEPADAELSDW